MKKSKVQKQIAEAQSVAEIAAVVKGLDPEDRNPLGQAIYMKMERLIGR